MALTFENQLTGRKVVVLEPDELAEQLAKVKRRGKPLDPKRIRIAKKRRERTIQKLNDSWKWKRSTGGARPATRRAKAAKAAKAAEATGDQKS